MSIAEYIAALEAFGIFNFYLPFFILFAMFYALLAKSGIFGRPEEAMARKINLIVALGASIYILIYSPISGIALDLGKYLATLFGQTFVILMGILVIMIIGYVLLPPLGVKMEVKRGFLKFLVCIVIILGIGIFITSGGLAYFMVGWPAVPTYILPWLTLEHIAIISLIVLTGLVLYWLVAPPKELMEVTPEERRAIEELRRARR